MDRRCACGVEGFHDTKRSCSERSRCGNCTVMGRGGGCALTEASPAPASAPPAALAFRTGIACMITFALSVRRCGMRSASALRVRLFTVTGKRRASSPSVSTWRRNGEDRSGARSARMKITLCGAECSANRGRMVATASSHPRLTGTACFASSDSERKASTHCSTSRCRNGNEGAAAVSVEAMAWLLKDMSHVGGKCSLRSAALCAEPPPLAAAPQCSVDAPVSQPPQQAAMI